MDFISRAVIFSNGELRDPERLRREIRADDLLLCADGGTRHALSLGLTPHMIIGDLDSLEAGKALELESRGVKINRYPRDKDQTDLELAIQEALDSGCGQILVVAALGKRLDQTLGNLALLTDPALDGIQVRLVDGREEVLVSRNECELRGEIGDLVSLVPWGDKVDGVVTRGLRWALHGETLFPHRTRGISNEMTAEKAEISLSAGLLLVVHSWQEI